EAEFLERLKDLAARDVTIIVSTHRLSLLTLVDRLLVFERGRLMADGPRDQVLAMFRGGAKPGQPAGPLAAVQGGQAPGQPAAPIVIGPGAPKPAPAPQFTPMTSADKSNAAL